MRCQPPMARAIVVRVVVIGRPSLVRAVALIVIGFLLATWLRTGGEEIAGRRILIWGRRCRGGAGRSGLKHLLALGALHGLAEEIHGDLQLAGARRTCDDLCHNCTILVV